MLNGRELVGKNDGLFWDCMILTYLSGFPSLVCELVGVICFCCRLNVLMYDVVVIHVDKRRFRCTHVQYSRTRNGKMRIKS